MDDSTCDFDLMRSSEPAILEMARICYPDAVHLADGGSSGERHESAACYTIPGARVRVSIEIELDNNAHPILDL